MTSSSSTSICLNLLDLGCIFAPRECGILPRQTYQIHALPCDQTYSGSIDNVSSFAIFRYWDPPGKVMQMNGSEEESVPSIANGHRWAPMGTLHLDQPCPSLCPRVCLHTSGWFTWSGSRWNMVKQRLRNGCAKEQTRYANEISREIQCFKMLLSTLKRSQGSLEEIPTDNINCLVTHTVEDHSITSDPAWKTRNPMALSQRRISFPLSTTVAFHVIPCRYRTSWHVIHHPVWCCTYIVHANVQMPTNMYII